MSINALIKLGEICCACTACEQICPKHCISMTEDAKGFLYPKVVESMCVECGLCEKVCPALSKEVPVKPQKVYAAIHKDESVRLQSSSGGIFTALAEKVIQDGGVVFGARFDDDWNVVHDYTESIDGLASFRGSKYVQSRVGDNYAKVKSFLTEGRTVLFTGTPCQTMGLWRFLRKDYENLIVVDFVCHGVPSSMVWRKYLNDLKETHTVCVDKKNNVLLSLKESTLVGVSFRDKRNGWKKFGFATHFLSASEADKKWVAKPLGSKKIDFFEPYNENAFMCAFLWDLCLRPSCYNCPAKGGRSHSDITIADYWGVQNVLPDFDDDKGCSLVMLHTERGTHFYEKTNVISYVTTYEQALEGNPSIECSVVRGKYVDEFWKRYSTESFPLLIQSLEREMHLGVVRKIVRKFKSLLYKIFDLFRSR